MSMIVQAIAKKALKDTAVKNINFTNPYEESVPVLDRHGHATGKFKKRKRGFPEGLSENDLHILKRVRSRAYHLDMSLFNCCGIRFGWGSVIGFIPVIGDFIDCLMAYMLLQKCEKIDGGLPQMLRARMFFNILLDFGIGLVPIIGDIADALYRANTRNAWLLEAYLTKKAEADRKGEISDTEYGTLRMPTKPQAAQIQSQTDHGVEGQSSQEWGVTSGNNNMSKNGGDVHANRGPSPPRQK